MTVVVGGVVRTGAGNNSGAGDAGKGDGVGLQSRSPVVRQCLLAFCFVLFFIIIFYFLFFFINILFNFHLQSQEPTTHQKLHTKNEKRVKRKEKTK